MAYVLTGSRPVAEDLVQDAFLEAHRRWETIGAYDAPEAWLRRVLVNKATSRGRRLVTEAKLMTRLRSRRAEGPDMPEPSDEVWAAVRSLPRRQAQAIALRFWNDCTVGEIAAILGCGEETVKTHLSRARATLARRLDEP